MFISLPLCLPEEVFNAFSFLRNMLSNEFILSPGAIVQVRNWIRRGGEGWRSLHWPVRPHRFPSVTGCLQDFEEACYLLGKTGALQVTQHELLVAERGHRTLTFLTSLLDPFLQGYQVRGSGGMHSNSLDSVSVHSNVGYLHVVKSFNRHDAQLNLYRVCCRMPFRTCDSQTREHVSLRFCPNHKSM